MINIFTYIASIPLASTTFSPFVLTYILLQVCTHVFAVLFGNHECQVHGRCGAQVPTERFWELLAYLTLNLNFKTFSIFLLKIKTPLNYTLYRFMTSVVIYSIISKSVERNKNFDASECVRPTPASLETLTVSACVFELLCIVSSCFSRVFSYSAVLSTCLSLTVLDVFCHFPVFSPILSLNPVDWIPSLVSVATHHCYFSADIPVHPPPVFFFTCYIISTNISQLFTTFPTLFFPTPHTGCISSHITLLQNISFTFPNVFHPSPNPLLFTPVAFCLLSVTHISVLVTIFMLAALCCFSFSHFMYYSGSSLSILCHFLTSALSPHISYLSFYLILPPILSATFLILCLSSPSVHCSIFSYTVVTNAFLNAMFSSP